MSFLQRFKDYVSNALRTEPDGRHYGEIKSNLGLRQLRCLHAVLGIATEAGEVVDLVKKSLFYRRPLDTAKVELEIGDLMWYVALLCDELGLDLESILDKNIAKLKARYPERYTIEQSVNRDEQAEEDAAHGRSNG